MKINILSSKVYNRIAAGEVVDRPYSVVKELVENSIDAGATSITIQIANGGLSSIIVTDNGHGIEKDELKKALLPHATSKICSVKDLDNILSLGFRGEALASIASVSKITISSKTKEQTLGAKIYSEGGEIGNVEDCAMANGTEISVKNLFFNAPVRAKFLRSERAEESEISNTVARFILGHSEIAFKYIADDEIIFQSFGDGLESSMVCVYNAKIISDCFYIDTEKNGIKIKGYISKHHFTKANRSYQTVFINGRYVSNQTVSSAIGNAYSSYLMKRQYPFYVLNIDMPTEIVDVNVHPNKTDVRFSNNQIIYSTLYSVITKVLDGISDAVNIVVSSESAQNINNSNCHENKNDFVINHVRHNEDIYSIDKVVFEDSVKPPLIEIPENKKEIEVDVFAENKAFLEELEKKKKQELQTEIKIDKEIRLVGQALNTYIIFEDGLDLYFIDQHAAHERLLFDKLIDGLNNKEIPLQPLLVPFILNVNNIEFSFLSDNFESIKTLGVELEEFGNNAFKVSAIPAYLTEINLQKFFNDILSDMDNLKRISAKDVLMEKFAQKACKSAIKSGDKLSDSELDFLLNILKNNLGLKCPHGRPVAIKITRMEIDKWFKRIV